MVFVHEMGHYIVARLCGVKVVAFAIGMGKELVSWKSKSGTKWKICALPIGGYVQMYGDSDPASSPDFDKLKKLSDKQKNQSFHFKSLAQKSAIVAAGPLFNYLLAIAILWFMLAMNGKVVAAPEITMVQEKSAAAAAGIKVGDIITKIDGEIIKSFEDIEHAVMLNVGTPIKLELKRKKKIVKMTITPKIIKRKDIFGNDIETAMIGIGGNKIKYSKLNIGASFVEAVNKSIQISSGILTAMKQMLVGDRGLDQIGGPIKMAQYSGQTANLGIGAFFWFIALISINLGLVNLLPIPMLDGGHLMTYLIEAISGKKVAEKIHFYGARIGFALLISIMFVACFNDIKGLIDKF